VYYTSPITQVIAPGQNTVYPSSLSTTNALYWDTSGNVGIGTSSPIAQSQLTVASKSLSVTGSDGNFSAGGVRAMVDFAGGTQMRIGALDGGTATATTLAFLTSPGSAGGNERMRIDSNGNLLVNTTITAGNASTFKSTAGAGAQAVSFWNNATSSTRYFVTFGTEASYTERGFITWNGTTTALSNASDFRLKENIVNAPSALQKIAEIQIRSFDFKENGRHVEYGVIAQELIEVIPAAVFEGSDNEDGSINKAWSVGLEPIIPVLVKAVQEQQALITALTARITALENK